MTQETHGQFFDKLALLKLPDGTLEVCAMGPRGPHQNIKEICVWVFQRDDEGNDVAATEMSTAPVGSHEFEAPEGRWILPITKLEESVGEFHKGPAIALAIALIDAPITNRQGNSTTGADGKPETAQKVVLWSQSIDLDYATDEEVTERVKAREQTDEKLLREAEKYVQEKKAEKEREGMPESTPV